MSFVIAGVHTPDLEEELKYKGLYFINYKDGFGRFVLHSKSNDADNHYLPQTENPPEPDVTLVASIYNNDDNNNNNNNDCVNTGQGELKLKTPLSVASLTPELWVASSRDGVHMVWPLKSSQQFVLRYNSFGDTIPNNEGYFSVISLEDKIKHLIQNADNGGSLPDGFKKSDLEDSLEDADNGGLHRFLNSTDTLSVLTALSGQDVILTLFLELYRDVPGRVVKEYRLDPSAILHLRVEPNKCICNIWPIKANFTSPPKIYPGTIYSKNKLIAVSYKNTVFLRSFQRDENDLISLSNLDSVLPPYTFSSFDNSSSYVITDFDFSDDYTAAVLENYKDGKYVVGIIAKDGSDVILTKKDIYRTPRSIKLYRHDSKLYCLIGCIEGDLFVMECNHNRSKRTIKTNVISRNCFMTKHDLYYDNYDEDPQKYAIKKIAIENNDHNVLFSVGKDLFKVDFNFLRSNKLNFYDPNIIYTNLSRVELPHRIVAFH
ncbi:MAG: hypothetical protein ABIG89_02815 [Candidatus Woesearchaeota archaeon]